MAKKATYEAIATLNNGKVEWELCLREPAAQAACGKTKASYPDIWLDANQGEYDFEFNITDQTNLGIKFAGNPLWIKKGNQPTGPSSDPQIGTPNGQGSPKLTFVDKNTKPDANEPNPYKLKYQLNFIDKDGNETSIDPEILNGGTNMKYEPDGPGMIDPGSGEFWALLGMIFIASLAAMLAARMFKFGR